MHKLKTKLKTFKGAGILIGFTLSVVAGILGYVISKNIGIVISLMVAIGLPIGLSFEEHLQGKKKATNPKYHRILIIMIGLGIIMLTAFFFITKYVGIIAK